MNSTSGGWVNLLIVWAVASAAGFFAMVALMIVGDWSLVQAIFAAAVVFVVLGTVLAFLFLKPLPGPQKPGTAGQNMTNASKPAPQAAPKPAPKSEVTPAVSSAVAATPAHAEKPTPKAAAKADPAPAAAAADAGAGTRPATLSAARGGAADDLKRIKGIGPKLEKLCNSLGFYHFDQIAGWTPDEIAWVDQNLEGFKGRVVRDNWVAQAKALVTKG
jgi:predicted flap endonuclease-1-like 5' DNA nuclease